MNWKNVYEIAAGVGIGIMAARVALATGDLVVAVTMRLATRKK